MDKQEETQLEQEEQFYNGLKDNLLKRLLSPRRADDAVVIAPYLSFAVWYDGILYSPRFLTVDTYVHGDLDYRRGLLQLKIINDELIPKIEGVFDMEEDGDIEDAIKELIAKSTKTSSKEKIQQKKSESEELKEIEKLESEDENYYEDIMDNDTLFNAKWRKTNKDMVEKSFIQFDELISMKGSFIMHVYDGIYIVSSMSYGDSDWSKINSTQDAVFKELRSPKTIAKAMISLAYSYATNVALKFSEGKANKIDTVNLDISCSKMWANGRKMFDLCPNFLKKTNCPKISKDYICDISQNLVSEMTNIRKDQ